MAGYISLAAFSIALAVGTIAWMLDFDFRFENEADRAIREFASSHRATDLRFPGAEHQPVRTQTGGPESYDLSSSALSFAEREIDAALQEHPSSSRHLFRRAQVHLLYMQPTPAIDLLERLRPFSPRDPALLGALGYAHYVRGRADKNLGELLRSIDFFNQALESAPQDAVLLFNAAIAQQRVGNRKEAAILYQRLLSLGEEDGWSKEASVRLLDVTRDP